MDYNIQEFSPPLPRSLPRCFAAAGHRRLPILKAERLSAVEFKPLRVRSDSCAASSSKACREKLHKPFSPHYPPFVSVLLLDKAAILIDAVRMVTQLLGEAQRLKDSNMSLQEKIKELMLGILVLFVSSSITISAATNSTATQGRKTLPPQSNNNFVQPIVNIAQLSRGSFPPGFVFGTASAAYQYEGAAFEGGKGPNSWDNFTHQYPEKIKDRSTGDVANDQYHRYKEDIGIMKYMNLDAYRFSISWSRVLPKGKVSGGVNREGINYYNNLINDLLANGLQPYVTLFHWDVPQALMDEYQGFLSPLIVNDFRDYADLCFKEFGDRVKHWITLNEPVSVSSHGYSDSTHAPGRCSKWLKLNCTGGDSGTEPYLTAHYQLLSHAAAANVYKTKYKASQNGLVGITLHSFWYVPMSEKKPDQDAAQRGVDFMFGWYMDPITKGEYPQSMRSLVGKRLPVFSQEESNLLKGSFDFLGLNYYATYYAANSLLPPGPPLLETDSRIIMTPLRDGKLIGPSAASSWLVVYPKGFRELLLYVKERYNNPLIYITENGRSEYSDPTLSVEEALLDTDRYDYLYRHLYYLQTAIRDGVNVKGYFHWSLLDNMEWDSGYTVRFGLVFVDFKDGLKRYPKLSAQWFKNFLSKS